jgi:pimeloyl-ACP methyl ester carboxylesterase
MLPLWIGLGIAALFLMIAVFYLWIVPNLAQDTIRSREVYLLPATDLWKLRVCRYRQGRSQGEPVLLVHGAGANQHNFTTPPGQSLVDYLVERGYDCWTVDLRGCYSSVPPYGHGPHEACFDDYLYKDLPPVVQHIRRTTGYGQLHWIGHSLGGMLLYGYVQAFGEKHIASATTMASPLGFEGTKLKFPVLLLPLMRWFPRLHGRVMRAYVPIGYTLGVESPMFPINMKNLHPEVTRRGLITMLDVPQPHVLDELMYCARHKVWRVDNGRLDLLAGLGKIKVPLLAIFAPRDPFIPLDRARKFVDALPHEDKQILILSKDNGCAEDYDHCEIPFAKHARREVFEPIERWMAAHPITSRYEDELEAEPTPVHVATLDDETRKEILSGDSFSHAKEGAPATAPPILAQTVPGTPGAAAAMKDAKLPAAAVQEVSVSPAVRHALASAKMQLLAMESKASPSPQVAKERAKPSGSVGKKTTSKTTTKAVAKKKPAASTKPAPVKEKVSTPKKAAAKKKPTPAKTVPTRKKATKAAAAPKKPAAVKKKPTKG